MSANAWFRQLRLLSLVYTFADAGPEHQQTVL